MYRVATVILALITILMTPLPASADSLLNFLINQKQEKYADLKLDMSRDEVIYVRGFPHHVVDLQNEESLEPGPWSKYNRVYSANEIPQGKSIYDYSQWDFQYGRYRIDVFFDPKKKTVKSIRCYSNTKDRDCPTLSGISDGDSEDQVSTKFGAPSSSEIKVPTKTIEYNKLGYRFYLTQLKVYMIELYK